MLKDRKVGLVAHYYMDPELQVRGGRMQCNVELLVSALTCRHDDDYHDHHHHNAAGSKGRE